MGYAWMEFHCFCAGLYTLYAQAKQDEIKLNEFAKLFLNFVFT